MKNKNGLYQTTVYLDCSLNAWSNRPDSLVTQEDHKKFDEEWLSVKSSIKTCGFVVLELQQAESPNRDVDSVDLAGQADIIVALGDFPSTGFSSIAEMACTKAPGKAVFIFWKKGLDFIPRDMPAASYEAIRYYTNRFEIPAVLGEYLDSRLPFKVKIPV